VFLKKEEKTDTLLTDWLRLVKYRRICRIRKIYIHTFCAENS
jgi:hypothetical protein